MKNFHRNSIKLNHREPQRLNDRTLYKSFDEDTLKVKATQSNKTSTTGDSKLWCIFSWCF